MLWSPHGERAAALFIPTPVSHWRQAAPEKAEQPEANSGREPICGLCDGSPPQPPPLLAPGSRGLGLWWGRVRTRAATSPLGFALYLCVTVSSGTTRREALWVSLAPAKPSMAPGPYEALHKYLPVN